MAGAGAVAEERAAAEMLRRLERARKAAAESRKRRARSRAKRQREHWAWVQREKRCFEKYRALRTEASKRAWLDCWADDIAEWDGR